MRDAKDTPLNVGGGTLPNVSGAMAGWFQPMTFGRVTKVVSGYQTIETVVKIAFRGVIQPLTNRQLAIKPEGQRAWTWLMLHAEPSLKLEVDDVVTYLGTQTRIMALKDYAIYGYIYYELVQDWTGVGPSNAT